MTCLEADQLGQREHIQIWLKKVGLCHHCKEPYTGQFQCTLCSGTPVMTDLFPHNTCILFIKNVAIAPLCGCTKGIILLEKKVNLMILVVFTFLFANSSDVSDQSSPPLSAHSPYAPFFLGLSLSLIKQCNCLNFIISILQAIKQLIQLKKLTV